MDELYKEEYILDGRDITKVLRTMKDVLSREHNYLEGEGKEACAEIQGRLIE